MDGELQTKPQFQIITLELIKERVWSARIWRESITSSISHKPLLCRKINKQFSRHVTQFPHLYLSVIYTQVANVHLTLFRSVGLMFTTTGNVDCAAIIAGIGMGDNWNQDRSR